jgi:DNA-binding NarL/FixJ family response regulator
MPGLACPRSATCTRVIVPDADGMTVVNTESKTPIRIAIVEDDLSLRKVLVSTLQADPDYTVVAEFSEGGQAIRAMAQLAPDMVLVDLGLPDMSGIEVIQQIKALDPQCDILVVTTFGDERTITSALEAGANGYLLKGTTLEELRRDVHQLRTGGSPLSPMVARQLLNKLQSKPADSMPQSANGTKLTPREHDILQMIAKGFSYVETAQICGVASATVHSHLKSIYRKLEVHSKTEAVYEARRRNLIS